VTEKTKAPKSTIALSVILSLTLIALIGLSIAFFDTSNRLNQTDASLVDMTTKQEATAATLATTEATLTETQSALADMTAKQETTAATLATTEATLTETQSALSDMTAKQETTAATLATTEATLTETQSALADMTAKQETTAATLATTEATLTETQSALADMTAKQETTAAILAATEATLTETQSALADMTAKQEVTAAALATTETALTETQSALVDTTAQLEKTASALAEKEAALETVNAEITQLKASSQNTAEITGAVNEIDSSDISLSNPENNEYTVLKEYEWESYGTKYLALIVKNTSGSTKDITGQVLFYSEDGNLLGASSPEQYVCGDEQEVFLSCSCDSNYSYYEYSVELTDSTFGKNLNDSVSVSITLNSNNAILMFKNTGTEATDSLEYNCLFFDKNNKIVATDWGFVDTLSPNKSKFEEIDPYEEYDRIEVYYSALSWGF